MYNAIFQDACLMVGFPKSISSSATSNQTSLSGWLTVLKIEFELYVLSIYIFVTFINENLQSYAKTHKKDGNDLKAVVKCLTDEKFTTNFASFAG